MTAEAAGPVRVRLPPPPALFIGREHERERLLALVPAHSALICGVAGVGKTALALLVADQWQGPVVFRKLARPTPRAELYEDLCRHLGAPLPADETALVAMLDREAVLWLIDDLHWLAPTEQLALFELAAHLRRARLLATSRELLRVRPGDHDLLQVKLDGLTEPQARALWTHLDRLYGPTGSLERAWASSRGNPFLLRQAHVAPLDDERPLAATWDALSGDEHRLASALALAQARLPIATLCALLPEDRARAALRGLATRLIVEIDTERGCTVHDLFREVALARLAGDERAAPRCATSSPRRCATARSSRSSARARSPVCCARPASPMTPPATCCRRAPS